MTGLASEEELKALAEHLPPSLMYLTEPGVTVLGWTSEAREQVMALARRITDDMLGFHESSQLLDAVFATQPAITESAVQATDKHVHRAIRKLGDAERIHLWRAISDVLDKIPTARSTWPATAEQIDADIRQTLERLEAARSRSAAPLASSVAAGPSQDTKHDREFELDLIRHCEIHLSRLRRWAHEAEAGHDQPNWWFDDTSRALAPSAVGDNRILVALSHARTGKRPAATLPDAAIADRIAFLERSIAPEHQRRHAAALTPEDTERSLATLCLLYAEVIHRAETNAPPTTPYDAFRVLATFYNALRTGRRSALAGAVHLVAKHITAEMFSALSVRPNATMAARLIGTDLWGPQFFKDAMSAPRSRPTHTSADPDTPAAHKATQLPTRGATARAERHGGLLILAATDHRAPMGAATPAGLDKYQPQDPQAWFRVRWDWHAEHQPARAATCLSSRALRAEFGADVDVLVSEDERRQAQQASVVWSRDLADLIEDRKSLPDRLIRAYSDRILEALGCRPFAQLGKRGDLLYVVPHVLAEGLVKHNQAIDLGSATHLAPHMVAALANDDTNDWVVTRLERARLPKSTNSGKAE